MGEDNAAKLHLDDHLKLSDDEYAVHLKRRDDQNRIRQERFVAFFGKSNVDMIRESICDGISSNEIPKHKLDHISYRVEYKTPIKPIRNVIGFDDFIWDESLRDSALQQEVDTNDQFQVTRIHVEIFPLINPRYIYPLCLIIIGTLVLPCMCMLSDYFTSMRKEDSVCVNVSVTFWRRLPAPAQGIQMATRFQQHAQE